eukprot:GSChrysophyteH1.ASY1.ANO1.2524.1 assembled CDS
MSKALQRLRKELSALKKKPIEGILAEPLESNMLEWHYVLEGHKGSPYEGGHYHGKLIFPQEYPFKPPSIMMTTPNGRFETNTRLCLSMSDFHPEQWNPLWSVGTILCGLYSFMQDDVSTYGSINTSASVKRQYARTSLEHNCKNKTFTDLFPDLNEIWKQRQKISQAAAAAATSDRGPASSSSAATSNQVDTAASIGKDIGTENLAFAVIVCILSLLVCGYFATNVV